MKKQMVTLVTATALASALGIASQQQSASAATNAPQVTANLKTAQSNDNEQNVQPEADTNNADGTDVKTSENDSETPAASQTPASQAPASQAPASQAPATSQAPEASQAPVASQAPSSQAPAADPADNDKTDQPTASSAEEPTTNVQVLKASAPAATKNVTYQTDPNLTDANGEINPGYLMDAPNLEENDEDWDTVTKDATLTLNIAGKEEQRTVKNVVVKVNPEDTGLSSAEIATPKINGYKSTPTTSVYSSDDDLTALSGEVLYFPINNTSTAPIQKREMNLELEIDGQKKLTYLGVDAQPWTIVTVPAPKITGYKANTDTVELGISDDEIFTQLTDLSYTRIPNVTIPNTPRPTKYHTENVTFPGIVNGKDQRIMFKNLTVKIANGDDGNPGYWDTGTYTYVKTPVLEGYKSKPTTWINMREGNSYDNYIWTLDDSLAYFPIHNTTNAKPITTTGYVATVGDDGVSRTVTGKPWSIVTIAAPKVAGYTPNVDTIEIGISDSTEYFYVLTDLKYTKTSELGSQNSQSYTRNVTIEKGGQWTTVALNFTSKPGQTVKVKVPTVAGYKADMATMRVEINRLTGEIEQLDTPQYTKVAGATTDAKDNNNSGSTTTDAKDNNNDNGSTTTDSKTNNNNGSTTTGSKANGTGNGTTTGTDSTQNQNGTTTTTTDGQKTTASTTTNHDGTTTDSLNGTNSQGTATGVGTTATGAQLNGGVTTTNVATNAKGQTSLAATNADTKTTQGKTATGDTLPQTGETHQGYLAVLGAFLLGMLGLTKVSRKHRA
ncbi:LPXTG cell wall anchor domain-containing protein [Lactiplantibacillus modestisalitolerans]|uniref:LPXTG cell wall anchor domain-containing protein n=1 Tax=Lactiplantibacillus modestisalitolerans TaxID=1457219 RepID=A0ABV5WSG1_9LACO|nr:LPXTG cell wall anchor domain-containing protein [Lactiplantibacillus modestisalitolerans]